MNYRGLSPHVVSSIEAMWLLEPMLSAAGVAQRINDEGLSPRKVVHSNDVYDVWCRARARGEISGDRFTLKRLVQA